MVFCHMFPLFTSPYFDTRSKQKILKVCIVYMSAAKNVQQVIISHSWIIMHKVKYSPLAIKVKRFSPSKFWAGYTAVLSVHLWIHWHDLLLLYNWPALGHQKTQDASRVPRNSSPFFNLWTGKKHLLKLSEPQYFVWYNASQNTKWQNMLEIWGNGPFDSPESCTNLLSCSHLISSGLYYAGRCNLRAEAVDHIFWIATSWLWLK